VKVKTKTDLETRKPGRVLSRGPQNMFIVFGILLRFLKNWLESGNLACSATAGTKTALGIIQLWLNYLAASFLEGSWYTLLQGG